MGNDMYNEEQLEDARDRARLASKAVVAEREIEDAQRLLTSFGIPEQLSPFKTPIAPLAFRIRKLAALLDQEVYLSERAKASHANDVAALRAEITGLYRQVARLVVALQPLAALAPAYAGPAFDGAAILTVQVPDVDSTRNVQLLPSHALNAASVLAEVG